MTLPDDPSFPFTLYRFSLMAFNFLHQMCVKMQWKIKMCYYLLKNIPIFQWGQISSPYKTHNLTDFIAALPQCPQNRKSVISWYGT